MIRLSTLRGGAQRKGAKLKEGLKGLFANSHPDFALEALRRLLWGSHKASLPNVNAKIHKHMKNMLQKSGKLSMWLIVELS